jgi:hypothetical protein
MGRQWTITQGSPLRIGQPWADLCNTVGVVAGAGLRQVLRFRD